MEENRKKALAAALGQIEKQFGKGSVMRLGDAAANYDVETVSTGSLARDIAWGGGGLRRGWEVEVKGRGGCEEASVNQKGIAAVQTRSGTAAIGGADDAG